MLDKNNLVQLAKTVAKADKSAPVAYSFGGENFSYDALNETLRAQFKELAGTPQLLRENKNTVFAVIEETITDVLPKRVTEAYEQFAEVRTFAQGDRPLFRRKMNSRTRAKQFVTRVGLAGVYEVFRMAPNSESFEVPTSAIGTAAQIGFEEFLDGRVDFADLIDVVMEGMDDLIYREIGAALKGSINQLPAANRVAVAGFNEQAFDKLLAIAQNYGTPTIYCTFEFAVKMVPQEAWRYTEAMKDELYRTGRLATYKGHNVVILPQGLEDESNSKKVIDPGYCWIMPAGADTKPVKIAFEGGLQLRERPEYDWAQTYECYQKVGVVCMMSNNIFSYVDTALLGQMTAWNLQDTAANVIVTRD